MGNIKSSLQQINLGASSERREVIESPLQLGPSACPRKSPHWNLAAERGLVDFDQKIRIELGILVHPVLGITSWIAHHPRAIEDTVEAVVRMSMYPKACPGPVGQALDIGYEARVQERVRKPRVNLR